MLYNGWERWITTLGADIEIGDGSKKTFKTVMGSLHEDIAQTSKLGEKQDDEETWGLEGGYSSDTVIVALVGQVGRAQHLGVYSVCALDQDHRCGCI